MSRKKHNGRKGPDRNGSTEESRSHVRPDENSTYDDAREEASPDGATNASDAEPEGGAGAQAAPPETMDEAPATGTDSFDDGSEGHGMGKDLSDDDLEDLPLEDGEAGLASEPEESSEAEREEGVGETHEGISHTPSGVASAPSQDPDVETSESHGKDEAAEKLSQISPQFFGLARKMSVDEVVELVDNTDRESDALTKGTGRVLSVQSAMDPELLTKLKDRKDRKTHIGTVRKWKLAGDEWKELEDADMSADGLTTYQLHAISRAPEKEDRIRIAKEAIEQNLSVRDIGKKVSPLAKRAKMEATGEIIDLSDRAITIMEGLDDPQKLMQDPDISMILQDPNRLKAELSFSELSTIHEKAKKVEKKTEKQKTALENKAAKYVPAITFLRVVRESISRAFEG